MRDFNPSDLKKLYRPPQDSHKGQNGKLLIIAGSGLFHAPAIWPAEIASRIVDMVYVASTPSNNKILQELKGKFWDGIVIRRDELADYAKEADCILIGPGLPRPEGEQDGDEESRELTKFVLTELIPDIRKKSIAEQGFENISHKPSIISHQPRVVIDGGALQVMEPKWIPEGAILTPHRGEWERLWKLVETKLSLEPNSPPALSNTKKTNNQKELHRSAADVPVDRQSLNNNGKYVDMDDNVRNSSHTPDYAASLARADVSSENLSSPSFSSLQKKMSKFANRFDCIVLLKGKEDIVCSAEECKVIKGGNAGMTKGGTGDVLAGLVAALACKNNPFLAACAGSYINKEAGDVLYNEVGPYYNASDLLDRIPQVMHTQIYG